MVHQQALARHSRQAECGMSGCLFQKSTRPPVELDDFQLLVDHDAGGYVAVYQQALYLLPHSESRLGKLRRARVFGFPLGVIEPREGGDQARRRFLLLIDLVFLVDEREVIGKSTQAFRSAEHQITGRLEPVMHRGNDALLKNRPEINEQVAAADQIEVRERRVLREILISCRKYTFPGWA